MSNAPSAIFANADIVIDKRAPDVWVGLIDATPFGFRRQSRYGVYVWEMYELEGDEQTIRRRLGSVKTTTSYVTKALVRMAYDASYGEVAE